MSQMKHVNSFVHVFFIEFHQSLGAIGALRVDEKRQQKSFTFNPKVSIMTPPIRKRVTKMMLKEFIERYYDDNQSAFAEHMEVDRSVVTRWIKAGWVVKGNILYSPKREIPTRTSKIK